MATTESATEPRSAGRRRLLFVFLMTLGYLIVEVIVGLWTHSLALLADAGHMFSDVGGLAIALFAMWFAERPATRQKTYGYYRTEILAVLFNSVVLILVSFFILYEAVRRFMDPPTVLSLPMLVVAVVGLGVNVISMRALHAGSHESLNVKGAYLEVLADMVSSLGVIVAALTMLATGWYVVDPLISAGIGLFILPRTWGLMTQAVNILMEAVPDEIRLEEVGQAMAAVNGVEEVHDLHVWTLTSKKYALSAHVMVARLEDWPTIQLALERLLADRFQVHHTTLQVALKSADRIGMTGSR